MKALLIIKPEALAKAGDIINTINQNSIKILTIKTSLVSKEVAQKLYVEHQGKYFYDTLIQYLTMGNCMLMAIEGDEQIILQTKHRLRQQYKPDNWDQILESCLDLFLQQEITPTLANTKNFSANFKTEYGRTFDAIHCSDPNKGEAEISLFFNEIELQQKEALLTDRVKIIFEKMANAQQQLLQTTKFFGGPSQ